METYIISNETYYFNNKYQKIFTIDRLPKGKLSTIVKQTNTMKRSEFQPNESNCILALYNPIHHNRLLKHTDEGVLLSFLQQNGYTVDTELTKIIKSFIVIKWVE